MDVPRTALLLTDQEWDDLSFMVSHFRSCRTWTPSESGRLSALDPHVADLERRRRLAARIIETAP